LCPCQVLNMWSRSSCPQVACNVVVRRIMYQGDARSSGAAHGLLCRRPIRGPIRRPIGERGTAAAHRSLARQEQQGADEAPQRLASEGPQQWTAGAESCGPRATDPNGSGTEGNGSTDPNGHRTEGNGRGRSGSAWLARRRGRGRPGAAWGCRRRGHRRSAAGGARRTAVAVA